MCVQAGDTIITEQLLRLTVVARAVALGWKGWAAFDLADFADRPASGSGEGCGAGGSGPGRPLSGG